MRVLEVPLTNELWGVLKAAADKAGATPNEIAQHLLEAGIESLGLPGELEELAR